jgi:ribonuclease E
MTKRMLIDSTHAEETRVVVLDGNRLEDYDVETSTKQQLKGNIYLAKVVRVEPSLQAAFVEYGGGRHGFLAFGEIHPDYYQIPVADRQRLMEMQEAEAREDEEAEERAAARDARGERQPARGGSPASRDVAAPHAATTDSVQGLQASADEGPDDVAGAPGADDAVAAPSADDAVAAPSADDAAAAPSADGDEPMPRPSQVAQAAAITQDILIALREAEAMFPDSDEGADMAPESVELATPDAPEAGQPQGSETNQPDAPDDGSRQEGGIEGAPDSGSPASAPDPVDSPPAETPDEPLLPEEMPSDAGLTEAADTPADAYANGHDAGAHDAAASDDAGPVPADDAVLSSQEEAEYAGPSEPPPEPAGAADGDEPREQRGTPRFLRNYKIQEVIRRRQILLIQVVKEERGTKGAALTTYISLAGRFSVLMPNSPRGGGISRKITSAADRRRLKEITSELELPRGMGLIVRTAGAQRPKAEILRDCEYLLDQWDQIRELTMKSMAPALIYEEASLIKRAIRDVYSKDVDDILVDGEQGWRAARDFMRMLMPTHAKKVQLWKDPQPLFAKAQVETQLDAMMLPTVQLRSGGYLVINQTEALVAIDVNSGRSTRERGIEETALRTNMEAAEEAARQLRLRDLAGLIVIDFIDMESRRNNAAVEKKLKDALKDDRARIQLGSISHFGLLEMSRQRLRPSIAETSFVTCPHCVGTGTVRSTESAALHVLRAVEEEGGKRRAAEIAVHVAGAIALYILNNKRVRLSEIEARHDMKVSFAADESLLPPEVRIDRVRAAAASDLPVPVQQLAPPEPFEDPDEEPADAMVMATGTTPAEEADDDEAEAPRPGETAEEQEQRGKRRRRRRRGGGRRDEVAADDANASLPVAEAPVADDEVPHEFDAVLAVGEAVAEELPAEDGGGGGMDAAVTADAAQGEDSERAKRRGRRGGRRRRKDGEAGAAEEGAEDAPAATPTYAAPPYAPPAYSGPTPADPFGGGAAFDIFDAIEQAEQQRALAAFTPQAPAAAAAQPEPEQPVLASATDDAAEARIGGGQVIDEMLLTEPVIVLPEMVSVKEADAPPVPAELELAVAEVVAPEVVAPESAAAHAEDAAPAVATETSAFEPATQASLVAAAPEAEPAPELAPAIVPILVGSEEPAEKKRGWWRK